MKLDSGSASAGNRAVLAGSGLESNEVAIADVVAGIPDGLREELFARFNDVMRNFRNGHWEAATLNGGKFCEVVYTILKGRADGRYPEKAEKPRDMVQACRALESADEALMGGRALRIQIPRSIPPIYEIRNNRGTGHAGAEIEPNRMDATYVLHSCQWILADLVRAYHRVPLETARDLVDALTERTVPLIWEFGDQKRVLAPAMEAWQRVMVLLSSMSTAVDEDKLRAWTSYNNQTRFRTQILRDLHNRLLIHYDEQNRQVRISPLGQRLVDETLLPRRS